MQIHRQFYPQYSQQPSYWIIAVYRNPGKLIRKRHIYLCQQPWCFKSNSKVNMCVVYLLHTNTWYFRAAMMSAHPEQCDSLFTSRTSTKYSCFHSMVAPQIVITAPWQQSWNHDRLGFQFWLCVTEGSAMLCFRVRTSQATVLSTHPCVISCLWVNWATHSDNIITWITM